MQSFCSLLSYRKTVPCGRMKKLHAPVGVPPSGHLASLGLLVRGLLPATTRRTGEEEEGGRRVRGKERRKREGRKREGEGKGEERRKWDRQTGSALAFWPVASLPALRYLRSGGPLCILPLAASA
jgi:hypothetical protein